MTMKLTTKKLPSLSLVVTVLATLIAMLGCNKAELVGGPENGSLPGRQAAITGLTSNNYLDYLSGALNYDWRTNGTIRNTFNNQRGSMPADASSPLSSGASRLFTNLAFLMCTTVANTEFPATPALRQTYRFLNTGAGPVIGAAATQQNEGAVKAFIANVTSRLWNRPPTADESAKLLAMWNESAPLAITTNGNNGNATRDVAGRICTVAAASEQARTAIQ
jgi:hypothetical protein